LLLLFTDGNVLFSVVCLPDLGYFYNRTAITSKNPKS